MKKIALFAFALLALAGLATVARAEESGTADLAAVYKNTNAFDGGDGSTINTSPAADEPVSTEVPEPASAPVSE